MTLEIDPLYPKACMIVQSTSNTRISHLQRVLLIGYNRSARLIEAMELDGLVSPCDSRGERIILEPKAQLLNLAINRIHEPQTNR